MIRSLSAIVLAAGLNAAMGRTEPRIELLAPSAALSLYHIVLADLDGDGDRDLVHLPHANANGGSDPHAYWIENLGNREFAPLKLCHIAPAAADEWLDRGTPASLTGRNLPNLFVSRSRPGPVHEPMALTPALDGPAPVNGAVLALGSPFPWTALDLDGDDLAELVQIAGGETEPWTLRIHERQADGSFSLTTETVIPSANGFPAEVEVEAIDLDHDGDLDLSVTGPSGLIILERNGARQFAPEPIFPGAGDDSYPGDWHDLNGDALPDLLMPDGTWRENLGSMTFAARPVSPAWPWISSAVFFSIVPRPGLPALALVVRPDAETGYRFATIPFDSAEPQDEQPFPGVASGSLEFILHEDIDGDGHRDLLHLENSWHGSGHALAVLWGSAAGFAERQVIHAAPSFSPALFTEDFDGDGLTDLILGPDAEGRHFLRRNRGRDGLGAPERIGALELPGYSVTLTGTGDVDQDGHPDLICRCVEESGTDYLAVAGVARGNGDGSFQPLELSTAPPSIAVVGGDLVDWDLDGDPDVVGLGFLQENVGGSFPLPPRHLIDLGSATDLFGNLVTIGFTRTGDLDGDGAPDIISAIYGEGEEVPGGWGGFIPRKMGIGFNDGSGGIGAIVEMPVAIAGYDFFGNPTVPGDVAIADLDRDGYPDLCLREVTDSDFFGNPTVTSRWLRNPGNGSRDPASWISSPLPDGPFPSRPFADFDGDGSPEWVGPEGYLKPTAGGPVAVAGFHFTGAADLSRMTFRTAADLDGDGDADFIIGGHGQALLLVHNPLVDGRDLITRALIASGVPGNLAGPGEDADGDGRSNEMELLTGTNPLVIDEAPGDPFQLGLQVTRPAGVLGFRLPWSTMGLAPDEFGLRYSTRELGLHHVVERSTDLLTWTSLNSEEAQLLLIGGIWSHLILPVACDVPSAYFRIRGERRTSD